MFKDLGNTLVLLFFPLFTLVIVFFLEAIALISWIQGGVQTFNLNENTLKVKGYVL